MTCLWMGASGQLVDASTLQELLLAEVDLHEEDADLRHQARQNLEQHMQFVEQVHRYAQHVGHEFTYQMGVHARHLLDVNKRMTTGDLPETVVHMDMQTAASRRSRRQLATATTSTNGSSDGVILNWCSALNPHKRSVCSAVKSQRNCGSCWAFAATDAIETAVAIAANQSVAVALAPQQFLSCSTREIEQSFTYCWMASSLGKNGSTSSTDAHGAPWLSETIKWKSANNGCAGGMTHGAFMDAAQLHYGLVTELEMPYNDKSTSNTTRTCVRTSNQTAASITDWKQVVGHDCSVSRDPNVLLKSALQSQPIAVAVNSQSPFPEYKGGFYTCPNNGDLVSKNSINHALLLVGYGTDAVHGDYWILKNSYGSSWGDSGFMKLLADGKTNCGLNIFPVVPVGAKAGVATAVVDGGGAKVFLGFSPTAWLMVVAGVTLATLVLTAVGVCWSMQRRAAIRALTSGNMYVAVETPRHHQQQRMRRH
uniref:Peptidase C1A papain C-terminal domain-containing protein n=1 Tax=Globisporangium ultimum (strain ATCC 200006 / CBS 805.95 / DAOM BR144) TaxID=431595 RepID=K3W9V8_GLOUD